MSFYSPPDYENNTCVPVPGVKLCPDSAFVSLICSRPRSERRRAHEHQGFPDLHPRLPAAHRPDEIPPPGPSRLHRGPLHGKTPLCPVMADWWTHSVLFCWGCRSRCCGLSVLRSLSFSAVIEKHVFFHFFPILFPSGCKQTEVKAVAKTALAVGDVGNVFSHLP